MYCADHDEIVCATCIALNHRTCQNLHSVPDELDNLFEKSAADETKLQLLAEKDKMEVIKNTKEHLITELDNYKEVAVASIKRFRKEMGALLDTLESESIRNLEEEHVERRERLEDEIKVAKKYIAELQLSVDKIIKSFGNKAQEFVCVKVAKRTIFETLDSEKILTKTVNVNIEFTANPKIKSFLNELKTFGIVPDPAINKPKTTLYEVDCKRQINIRQADDKAKCSIYGSCFTADGLLLLADYSNKKLKCVDLCSKKVKDYLDLEASPADVCQMGKDEIAVSLDNKSIQFVSLENKMATAKLLKLDYYCWGLAYKDAKLFVTDCSTSLYIHDMNGSMLHKITTDQQGNAFFQSNRHISLSSDGDMIYIADYNKGVITLNLQGNYESTCTDTDLFHIWGVCTDGRGNIFTCGFGRSNVVQVNEKSRYKTGVLGNVKNSTSACFDPQQNKLVVSPSDSDIVEVYELV